MGHVYASDGVVLTLAGSLLALICGAFLWGAYRVPMPRPVPAIVIGICSRSHGVFAQGFYRSGAGRSSPTPPSC
jgi:hypothetical protein